MWDLAIGIIIGIYLGTYYDFRPMLESLRKWGTEQLPPPRQPASTQSIFSALLTSEKT